MTIRRSAGWLGFHTSDGSDDFRTTLVVDPDGNRIELVQWPAGHADGMTAADFAEDGHG